MTFDTAGTRITPRWPIFLVSLTLLANLAALVHFGLLPDEAYYWVWSQRLELSYFDHPPLVAWLIRLFTVPLGNADWVVRLPAILSWLVGAWCAYDLSWRLWRNRRTAQLAVLVWASLPIVQIGFHIVTPDSPLILFTWLSYYFALRALKERHGWLWLAAGGCVGLALLAKYPAVLVALGLILGLAMQAEGRRLLAGRWPWLSAGVALLVFTPVLVWNAQHEWASFAFQLGHGVKAAVDAPLEMLLQFIAGQAAVAMPWTLLAMAVASFSNQSWRHSGNPTGYWLLAVGFWLPLLLFGAAGLTSKSHPNWPVTAYVPGTLLLAGALQHWLYRGGGMGGERRAVRWTVIAAVLLSLLLVNLMRYPQALAALGARLPPQRTQLSQSYGWEAVGAELRAQLAAIEPTHPADGHCVVVGHKLQAAGMLAYLLQDVHRVTVPPTTRRNQFHFWQEADGLEPAELCLYLHQFDQRDEVREQLDLGGQGRWTLARLLEVETPDRMRRWFGFYRPLQGE